MLVSGFFNAMMGLRDWVKLIVRFVVYCEALTDFGNKK
jgi:hypothetical protein